MKLFILTGDSSGPGAAAASATPSDLPRGSPLATAEPAKPLPSTATLEVSYCYYILDTSDTVLDLPCATKSLASYPACAVCRQRACERGYEIISVAHVRMYTICPTASLLYGRVFVCIICPFASLIRSYMGGYLCTYTTVRRKMKAARRCISGICNMVVIQIKGTARS